MPSPQPPPLPRLDGRPWLSDPNLGAVFRAIAAGGYEARVVGGAVRNSLLGRPVVDVDLATPARPEVVMRLARAAGLTAIPTGIEHGTVTVVSQHAPSEVTTLRRDIETFGRHARVTYTTDWTEDAARRDFTINALYCGADGRVHDPLGGWADVAARRVRFIGNPRDRIGEDYLRILRFFRFTAEYATGDPDPDGLAASVAMQGGLEALSGERLRAETLKLLVAPRAPQVLAIMAHCGILARIAGRPANLATLDRLVEIERFGGLPPDPVRRLAALFVTTAGDVPALRERLRLSNAEAATLTTAGEDHRSLGPPSPEALAKAHIYRHGADHFRAAFVLNWARTGTAPDDPSWRDRLALPDRFPRPVLPVRGSDVLSLGVTAGPTVGRVLAAFEAWWIGADFPDDPSLVAAQLAALVHREHGQLDQVGGGALHRRVDGGAARGVGGHGPADRRAGGRTHSVRDGEGQANVSGFRPAFG